MHPKASFAHTYLGGRFGALFTLCLLVGFLLAPKQEPAYAHQAKAALTEILFNTRSGNLEVAHRFILHDAEHAARLLFDKSADVIQSDKARGIFARYVAGNFTLSVNSAPPLDLTLLGAELEGDFLWVYQEAPLPKEKPTSLTLNHTSLTELWSSQMNTVNVSFLGKVHTATFVGLEADKSIIF